MCRRHVAIVTGAAAAGVISVLARVLGGRERQAALAPGWGGGRLTAAGRARRRRAAECPVVAALGAYLVGELDPAEHEQVTRHIRTCRTCAVELAYLTRTWRFLRGFNLHP